MNFNNFISKLMKKEVMFYGTIAIICLVAFAIMKYLQIVEGMNTGLEVDNNNSVKSINMDQTKKFVNTVLTPSNSHSGSGNTNVYNY